MARFLKNTDPRFHLVELRSGFFLGAILLMLLGAVGFGIWKQEWFRPAKHFRMTAETSEGLQTGMAVRLSGFRIGKVDAIELVGPGNVAVRVRVFDDFPRIGIRVQHFPQNELAAAVATFQYCLKRNILG